MGLNPQTDAPKCPFSGCLVGVAGVAMDYAIEAIAGEPPYPDIDSTSSARPAVRAAFGEVVMLLVRWYAG